MSHRWWSKNNNTATKAACPAIQAVAAPSPAQDCRPPEEASALGMRRCVYVYEAGLDSEPLETAEAQGRSPRPATWFPWEWPGRSVRFARSFA